MLELLVVAACGALASHGAAAALGALLAALTSAPVVPVPPPLPVAAAAAPAAGRFARFVWRPARKSIKFFAGVAAGTLLKGRVPPVKLLGAERLGFTLI